MKTLDFGKEEGYDGHTGGPGRSRSPTAVSRLVACVGGGEAMMMDQDYVGDKLVELLEERFIGSHERALLNLAGTQEQALARTGGVHQAKFF